jgi:hypothetical protein
VKIALSPEAVEPQRGIDLRADHDSNACRKPLDQVPQPLVDFLVVDRVVVVEDERDAGEAGGRVDDERQDVVLDDDARCLQSAQHLLSEAGSNGPEGGHHIGPEDGRRVVAPVERQPGDVPVVRRGGPLGEQRRLAGADPRRDQRQPDRGAALDLVLERGAFDPPGPERGSEQLRLVDDGALAVYCIDRSPSAV